MTRLHITLWWQKRMASLPVGQLRRLKSAWSQVQRQVKERLYRPRHARSYQRKDGEDEREEEAKLGKYAHEDQMPSCLRKYLESCRQNCRDGMIESLERLLNNSVGTRAAYLCNPKVTRITKLRHEGSFCGYRNIQMLISYLLGATEAGPRAFPEGMPSIFELQDRIEDAWDKGYNSRGRAETGGIRGTRKYIGTPEAEALFLSLEIECYAQRIKDSANRSAVQQLAEAIISYFGTGTDEATNNLRTRRSDLPPVYFQRPGHSLTIIGIEKSVNDQLHLLVFNPSRLYSDTTTFGPLSSCTLQASLENYRLRLDSLCKYSEFELLYLVAKPRRLSRTY